MRSECHGDNFPSGVNNKSLPGEINGRADAGGRKQVAVVCGCSTLWRHEVGEVPDEFAHHVLLPLQVEHAVVALQDHALVVLCEHQGRVLGREGRLNVSGQTSLKLGERK